jgi:hypothetical protein
VELLKLTIDVHCSADRYPNHEASKRIDKEQKEEIEKLRSDDGDYHHGFNSGVLATVRMFKEKADILHINDFKVSGIMLGAGKHASLENTNDFF